MLRGWGGWSVRVEDVVMRSLYMVRAIGRVCGESRSTSSHTSINPDLSPIPEKKIKKMIRKGNPKVPKNKIKKTRPTLVCGEEWGREREREKRTTRSVVVALTMDSVPSSGFTARSGKTVPRG